MNKNFWVLMLYIMPLAGCDFFRKIPEPDIFVSDSKELQDINWENFEGSRANKLNGFVKNYERINKDAEQIKTAPILIAGVNLTIKIQKTTARLPFRFLVHSDVIDFKTCSGLYSHFVNRLGKPEVEKDSSNSDAQKITGRWHFGKTGLEINCLGINHGGGDNRAFFLYQAEEANSFKLIQPLRKIGCDFKQDAPLVFFLDEDEGLVSNASKRAFKESSIINGFADVKIGDASLKINLPAMTYEMEMPKVGKKSSFKIRGACSAL